MEYLTIKDNSDLKSQRYSFYISNEINWQDKMELISFNLVSELQLKDKSNFKEFYSSEDKKLFLKELHSNHYYFIDIFPSINFNIMCENVLPFTNNINSESTSKLNFQINLNPYLENKFEDSNLSFHLYRGNDILMERKVLNEYPQHLLKNKLSLEDRFSQIISLKYNLSAVLYVNYISE